MCEPSQERDAGEEAVLATEQRPDLQRRDVLVQLLVLGVGLGELVRPTLTRQRDHANNHNQPDRAELFTNIIANQGALPIKLGDEVIGAAGASGAPGGEKDEACVKAALDNE